MPCLRGSTVTFVPEATSFSWFDSRDEYITCGKKKNKLVIAMGKEKPAKKTKGKKNENGEFNTEDPTIYFDLFKQLKGQFYKERGDGPRSTLETLKESLGGSVLKDVTFFYQKLNKKSSETIIKTLKEFFAMLEEKEPAFFVSLMASYSIIHQKLLTTEFERDVVG